jgi:hypothetical protein
MRSSGLFFFITLILLFLQCPNLKVLAQSDSVFELSGVVLDETGDPVIGAHIRTNFGTGSTTASDGHFRISLTQNFPLDIEISSIGHYTKKISITEPSQEPLTIILLSGIQTLQQVVVTSTRITNHHSQRLDPAHLTLMPSAAGSGIEGLVRSQMGVASNNELSSQYRVRGGNFDENLVYVNGQEIYRPFLMHSGQQEGLSFVNPDLVESVEFSAGGFSASYGDKMSSVLDITYKKPTETAGSFSAGMLGANGHLEGAVLNNKLTWITGARYKTNRYLLGSLDEKGDYHPNFTDVQAYLTYEASPRLSFDLLGYYSLNTYEFIPQSRETTYGTVTETRRLRIYFEGKEHDRFETGYGAFSTNYKVSDKQEYKLTLTGFRTFEEETYDIAGAYWLHLLGNPMSQDDDEAMEIGIGKYMQHARNDLYANVASIDLNGTHNSLRSITKWGHNTDTKHLKTGLTNGSLLILQAIQYLITAKGWNWPISKMLSTRFPITEFQGL